MNIRKIKLATTISIALIAIMIVPMAIGVPRPQNIAQGGPSTSSTDPMQFNVTLNARGASFPAPMIFNWIPTYESQTPGVTITYQSVGSGAGQRAFMNKTDDFDASDAPLSVSQRYLTPNVLHIPETIGSVTLSYNLPGITANLNLTGAIIAQIYMGGILNWNDPAIQSLNPHVSLPAHQIITVHRSDSSGTTFVFTSFLSQDSAAWASAIGASTLPSNWPGSPTGSPPPIALTGNGNGGVAAVIASTQYSFGYVELNYALQNGFTFAQVQNPAGNYIIPSLTTTNYAVQNSTTILPAGSGDWSSVNMLNRPGAQTYPIASFTYFLVYKELNVLPSMDLNETYQANALINFLYWVVNKGQQYTSALSYVPLPTFVRQIDNASIASITFTTPAKIIRTVHLSESASGGWNGTGTIGPTITIYSGDTVNLSLSSTDSAAHRWFVDYNNNGVLDANEVATASATFNSPTFTASPAITPAIGINVPRAGTFVYRDANNTGNSGTIQIIQQIVPAPYLVPATLNQGNALKVDSSKVSTIGTLIIDMRRLTVSGNITEVSADASSTTVVVTSAKSYLVPSLQLHTVPNQPGVQIRFVFNAAVSPYPLSSIGFLQLVGTTTTLTNQLTREVDMAADGFVSIVDVGVVFNDYGFSVGNPSYNPLADLAATGTINISDATIVSINYGAPVFR